MKFELMFITPVNTKAGEIRKLHFEGPDGERAGMLAGPWGKSTKVCKGTLDGAPLAAPFTLPLILKATEHGPVLRTNGVRLLAEGELVPALDAEGNPSLGKDKKPLLNLKVDSFEIVTYTLAAGDDEPALACQSDPFASSEEPALT